MANTNDTITTASNNSSMLTLNFKCLECDKDLNGSFRTMTHIFCGLRFCATHLQTLVLNKTPCARCARELKKEDLLCTPSLSASQKNTYTQQNQQPPEQPQPLTRLGQPTQPHLQIISPKAVRSTKTTAGKQEGGPQQQKLNAHLTFECPICSLKGLALEKLLEHSKTHAQMPGKCPICEVRDGKEYYSNHLYGHLMLRHKEKRQKIGTITASQNTFNDGKDTASRLMHINSQNGSSSINSRSHVQTANQTLLQASKGLQHSSQQTTPWQNDNKERNSQNNTMIGVINGKGTVSNQPKGVLGTNSISGSQVTQMAFSSSQQQSTLQSMLVSQMPSNQQSQVNIVTQTKKNQRKILSRRQSSSTAMTQNNVQLIKQSSAQNIEHTNKQQIFDGKPARLKATVQPSLRQLPPVSMQVQQNNRPGTKKFQEARYMQSPNAQFANISGGGADSSVPQGAKYQNQWISQGLIGVFTFSMVQHTSSQIDSTVQKPSSDFSSATEIFESLNGDGRRLQLTSQYLSSQHRQSLLRHQGGALDPNPFRLIELKRYIQSQQKSPSEQDKAKENQFSELSGGDAQTDDGLSFRSDSSQGSKKDLESQNMMDAVSVPSTSTGQISNRKKPGGKGTKKRRATIITHSSKTSGCRLSYETGKNSLGNIKGRECVKPPDDHKKPQSLTTKKPEQVLEVPPYLKEIQRICFPKQLPPTQSVLLKKDSTKQTRTDSQSKHQEVQNSEKQSPVEISKQVEAAQDLNDTSTRIAFSPQSGRKSSIRLNVKQVFSGTQQKNSIKVEQKSIQDTTSESRDISQKMIQVTQQKKNLTDKEAFQANQQKKNHTKPCTLELLQQYHKQIYYSTRTCDDKVQYLSILVCAQPQLASNSTTNSHSILEAPNTEDEKESANGVHALVEPFIVVIVTEKPDYESGFCSQMLDFIYQRSFLPLYRKICFPSILLSRDLELLEKITQKNNQLPRECNSMSAFSPLNLSSALGIMFDVLNIFAKSVEDSYRRIHWREPLTQNARQLLQVNNMICCAPHASFLLDCSNTGSSFRRLFTIFNDFDDLIKLFSCMILEKKIIFVGSDDKYQEMMAPLIETLLQLVQPLDSQVFTNMSYTLSEEMVFYMEKPGSIIMGMPKSLWQSHGQRIFLESFDPYVVVYDLEEHQFHLKTDHEMPIGLPRSFSKLLRRSLSAVNLSQSNLYVTLQIRQVFLNTLLLMISYINSQAAVEADKKLKLKALGVKNEITSCTADNQSESSNGSTQKGNSLLQRQYPGTSEFFKEFKITTAFIDLSEKIDRKDPTVKLISQCLKIIEEQKIDWFSQLLEFQAGQIASDVAELAPLFSNDDLGGDRSINADSAILQSEIQLDYLENMLEKENQLCQNCIQPKKKPPEKHDRTEYHQALLQFQKEKMHPNSHAGAQPAAFDLEKIHEHFRVQKRLVSKNLRQALFDPQSAPQHQCYEKMKSQMLSSKKDNFSKSNTDTQRKVPYALSSRNIFENDSRSPLEKKNQSKLAQLKEVQQIPIPTPQKLLIGQKSPKTPSGMGRIGLISLIEEADAPPSSARAARYSSTHKPQIAFKQVRSSMSPHKAQQQSQQQQDIAVNKDDEKNNVTKDEEKVESKPEDMEAKTEPKAGGFFSIITNFFSSGRPTIDESKKSDQAATNLDLALKSSKEEFKGRRASKSMQVIQPASAMSFGKPLNLQEVAKITNLASGHSLIKDLGEKRHKLSTLLSPKSNKTQRQSIKDLPRASSGFPNREGPSNENFILYASRQRSDKIQSEQQMTQGFRRGPLFQGENAGQHPEKDIHQVISPALTTSGVEQTERKTFNSSRVNSELQHFMEANGRISVEKKVEPFSTRIQTNVASPRLVQGDTPGFRSEAKIALQSMMGFDDSRRETLSQVQSEALAVPKSQVSMDFQPPQPGQRYLEQDSSQIVQTFAYEDTMNFQPDQINHSSAKAPNERLKRPTAIDQSYSKQAYRKDVLMTELNDPTLETCSNPNSFGDAVAAVVAPVSSSLSLNIASGSRAPTPNIAIPDAINARHSCPFQEMPQSPSSKLQPFWSIPKEDNQKRLSLNAQQVQAAKPSLQQFAASSSSKSIQSVTVTQQQLQPQQKSVRKATINLSKNSVVTQGASVASASRNQLIQAPQSTGNAAVNASGLQSNHSKAKSLNAGFGEKRSQANSQSGSNGRGQEALGNSNSQHKLKITINRLQSKQQQLQVSSSQLRQSSGSQLYPSEQQRQVGSIATHAQSHSVLIQAPEVIQTQELSVRNKQQQHCISPRILNQQHGPHQQHCKALQPIQSKSIDFQNAFELNRAQSSGTSLSIAATKNMNQQQQNLPKKGQSHIRRSAQQMFPGSGDNSLQAKLENSRNTVDEFDQNESSFSNSCRNQISKVQQIHQSNISKNKRHVGELGQQLNRHQVLVSPRQGLDSFQSIKNLQHEVQSCGSPNKQYKNRPKAYSQISRGGHEGAQASSGTNQTNAQAQGNKALKPSQTTHHSLIYSASTSNHTVSQSMHLGHGGMQNLSIQNLQPRTASKKGTSSSSQQQNDVLHNILARGMSSASQISHKVQNQQLDRHMRSAQKLMTFATLNSPERKQQANGMQKQGPSYIIGSSQIAGTGDLNKYEGSQKRGSISQLPKAANMTPSIVTTRQANTSDREITPKQSTYKQLSHKSSSDVGIRLISGQQPPMATKVNSVRESSDQHTPGDPKQSMIQRKQQQLTRVAQEKIGDEEQVEMENLQEALDGGGFEGNRIRSISHQYPAHMAFLRASQDKMQGIPTGGDTTNVVQTINQQQQHQKNNTEIPPQ